MVYLPQTIVRPRFEVLYHTRFGPGPPEALYLPISNVRHFCLYLLCMLDWSSAGTSTTINTRPLAHPHRSFQEVTPKYSNAIRFSPLPSGGRRAAEETYWREEDIDI